MIAMSPAWTDVPSKVASLAEQRADVSGQVGGMWLRNRSIGTLSVSRQPNVGRLTTRSRNGSLCGAPGQPMSVVLGVDVVHHDVGMSEFRTAHHCLQALHQHLCRCANWLPSVRWSPAPRAAFR